MKDQKWDVMYFYMPDGSLIKRYGHPLGALLEDETTSDVDTKIIYDEHCASDFLQTEKKGENNG